MRPCGTPADAPKAGRCPKPGGAETRAMGPIDFTQFVNELATLSGQAILPFFRTAICADDKSRGGLSTRSPRPTGPAKSRCGN